MHRLAIDDAAWTNAWRHRSTAEKAFLSLGLLLVALLGHAVVVGVLTGVAALLLALVGARISAPTLVRALAGPAIFVAVGLVAVVVTLDTFTGPTIWSWGPFAITGDSLARAGEIAARSFGAVSAMLLLAMTTPVNDLLGGMRRIGLPAIVVEISAAVYRMIFLLLDSQAAIRESQAARLGYEDRSTAVRSFGQLGAATLIRAWTRAQRLEDGLAGRGYDGSLTTVGRKEPVSWAFVAASAVLLAGLATLAIAIGLSR